VAVELRVDETPNPIWGHLSNTSASGCLIETAQPVKPGAKVVVAVSHDRGYRAALDLTRAGCEIVMVADIRATADGILPRAARLMGLNVDRTLVTAYAVSGLLAGMAGVILAAQFGAGQPNEGVGWELFAISAVVLGGTLLTGGEGSIAMTIAGVLLLGLVFNLLNFENGLGFISLSAYWQSVIRGVFLLAVIVMQARILKQRGRKRTAAVAG